jgi:hypothetical protein
MHALRDDLRVVRAARPDEEIDRQGPENLAPLIGLTKREITAELGTPDCDAGQKGRPCWYGVDALYSFYHLPSGWVGGGPELVLMFDVDEHCTAAEWRASK